MTFSFAVVGGLISMLGLVTDPAGAEEETSGAAEAPSAPFSATYSIDIEYLLPDVATEGQQGQQLVRFWAWLPLDDADQRVLDVQVLDATGPWSVHTVAGTGDRLIYLEARPSGSDLPILRTRAIIERDRIVGQILESSHQLGDGARAIFAEELRADVPHMEVDDRIRTLADTICGEQRDPLAQARVIYDEVIRLADHYSKGAVKPSSIGSASYCLDQAGGSCTDMHSLFIALCRARGIPARLTFGLRLNAEKLGEVYDPGYRCWAHVFIPQAGWIPVEVAAGDTVADQQDFYFGGLDESRIAMVHGRDLNLEPSAAAGRINITPKSAYAELDGQPVENIVRRIRFTRVAESAGFDDSRQPH